MDPDETPAMLWSFRQGGNYMQTPLAYGEEIYFCNDAGILTCYDILTGQGYYRKRLGTGRTGFTASGVAADGKLYFCSEEGQVYVVAAGTEFELLAENELGEECLATAAISEGVLYYRSRSHVTAIR
jgi:outer membrane protein assembly factor BamB